MRLLVLTEKVDEHDPALGFFHEWLRRLGERCSAVEVVCTSVGSHSLPSHVRIHRLRRNAGAHPAFVFDLLRTLMRLRGRYDSVFIHRTLTYAVFAGWWWRLTGKRMVLWYEYTGVTRPLRLAAFFVHAIATSASDVLGIKSNKIRVIGQALDTEYFAPKGEPSHAGPHLLANGRITQYRRIRLMVETLAALREQGIPAELTIIGKPSSAADEHYAQEILEYIAVNGLQAAVRILPSVPYTDLASYYQKSDLALYLASTRGREKGVLECMACGTPALVANPAYREIVGKSLEPQLLITGDDANAIARRITDLTSTLPHLRRAVRERVMEIVPTLDSFVNRLLALLAE